MPINVFGNSISNNSQNKIDTTLFVKKPYLRTNYTESNIEEDIDLKNQYRIRNLPDPISIEAASKNYIDNLFNDSSIVKNNAHIDLNDRNITNARFIQVNQLPQIDSNLTAKLYVDNTVDELTLVRNNQDNDFNDNKLTSINSITINNNPTDDNHVSNKKYIDDELDKNTLVRFNQTLKNYLKITIGNDTYNLTKYNKILLSDVTEIRYPEFGSNLLPEWKIYCNNRNNQSRIDDFIKSSITQSPSNNSGAESIPPIVIVLCI